MKKRINYIDIARAFAMIFIVLGHTLVHSAHCNFVFKLLYSFHVVLFFLLSGYTFKINENGSFILFIKNKFLRIMVPYFIWAVLFLVPYLLLGNKVGSFLGTNSSFGLKTLLINVVYGNGNLSALKQNSSLWFLPALFSMEIIYYYIISVVNKNRKLQIPILLFTIAISYITNYFLSFILPWGINTVLNVGVFFYIGYLLKDNNMLSKDSILMKWYIQLILLLIGFSACYLNSGTVSCIEYEYGNFTLMLLSGFCLSMVVIYISYLINKNKILEYIGRNTMGILIFHKLVILIFQTKLGKVSSLLKNSNIFIELILSIIIVIISIIVSLSITKIVNKIIPELLGNRREKS